MDIRHEFPFFEKTDVTYLDSAATTQKPYKVIDSIVQSYSEFNANPGRGSHTLSLFATSRYEKAREHVAAFFGCDPDELIFTSGATESLNIIAKNLSPLTRHVNFATAPFDHHSCILPWFYCYDSEDMTTKPFKSVDVYTVVSNVIGDVKLPHQEHTEDRVVVADLTQAVAHMPINLHEMNIDCAAFSAHKMYGPMGVGCLYIKRDLQKYFININYGGGMVEDLVDEEFRFKSGPQKFEAGTRDVAGVVALSAACSFLEQYGWVNITYHEQDLMDHLLYELAQDDRIEIYGHNQQSLVSFNVRGFHSSYVSDHLDGWNIAIRAGHMCALNTMRALDIDSCCRVSLGIYNTHEDIDYLARSLKELKEE